MSLPPFPIHGYRFSVIFLAGGVVPNPLDIRFQKVSELSATVETTSLKEGGQNLYTHKLPEQVSYQNLVLETRLCDRLAPEPGIQRGDVALQIRPIECARHLAQ